MNKTIQDYVRSRFEDAFIPITNEQVEAIIEVATLAALANLSNTPLEDFINALIGGVLTFPDLE